MINQPSLAILIDCWYLGRFGDSISETVYSNIINFLDTNEHVKTVVLASYNCRTEWLARRTWYDNNRAFFENNQVPRTIKDLAVVHSKMRHYDKTHNFNERTDPIILNYSNDNKFQIAMWWGWELEFYLKTNPHIKNVYVLGLAWDQCVKIRPLGYEAVSEIPNINVLTHTDCSANMNGSALDLDSDLNWKKLEEKIYQYVK